MTPDYDALEKLAKAAAPGPWMAEPFNEQWDVIYSDDLKLPVGINSWSFSLYETLSEATAKHIAAANPTAILELIAHARLQEERIGRLREAIKKHHTAWWTGEDVCFAECSRLCKALKEDDDAAMKDFKPEAMPQKAGENESIS